MCMCVRVCVCVCPAIMQYCANQCTGHGTCQLGYCKCDEGWYGTDCSKLRKGLPYPPNEGKSTTLAIRGYADTSLCMRVHACACKELPYPFHEGKGISAAPLRANVCAGQRYLCPDLCTPVPLSSAFVLPPMHRCNKSHGLSCMCVCVCVIGVCV